MLSSGNSPSQQQSRKSSSYPAMGDRIKSRGSSTSTSTSPISLPSSGSRQKTRCDHVPPTLHDPNPDQVDLVIPGPEQPLVDGVEPFFRKGKHDPRNNKPSSSYRLQLGYPSSAHPKKLLAWKAPRLSPRRLCNDIQSRRQNSAFSKPTNSRRPSHM